MELTPVAIIGRKLSVNLGDNFTYMNIQENITLAQYTTFKIGGPAKFFCICKSEGDLVEIVNFAKGKKLPIFILGGGSNILISDKGYKGLVIKMEIGGTDLSVVSAGAGVIWDDFVAEIVANGLYGLENLSAIPGTVGAAPVQNIGAYGMDVSRAVQSVRALDTKSMKFIELSNADCKFDYRDSVFKHEKGRYVITRVDFKLSKKGKVNIEYKDLKEYFQDPISVPRSDLVGVREAVVNIRAAKLPDWKKWGTAGSYFKNPIISKKKFESLKKKYSELPGFPESNGDIKISLGWVLDKVCNFKGLSMGRVKIYEKQALVIVASAGATAEEVMKLAQELMREVKKKTGIMIEGEVEWVN